MRSPEFGTPTIEEQIHKCIFRILLPIIAEHRSPTEVSTNLDWQERKAVNSLLEVANTSNSDEVTLGLAPPLGATIGSEDTFTPYLMLTSAHFIRTFSAVTGANGEVWLEKTIQPRNDRAGAAILSSENNTAHPVDNATFYDVVYNCGLTTATEQERTAVWGAVQYLLGATCDTEFGR